MLAFRVRHIIRTNWFVTPSGDLEKFVASSFKLHIKRDGERVKDESEASQERDGRELEGGGKLFSL